MAMTMLPVKHSIMPGFEGNKGRQFQGAEKTISEVGPGIFAKVTIYHSIIPQIRLPNSLTFNI